MKVLSAEKCYLLPPEHTLFHNCHASTIARLPDGELLAAFFAGTREGEGDVAVWLGRTINHVWQPPRRVWAEAGLSHWNPVLHVVDDQVWIFYKVGPSVHTWKTRWSHSPDLGHTWSPSRPLVPGDESPRGPVRNKLIVATNGDWIAPGSTETDEFWDAFADISSDQGNHWTQCSVPIDHAQPRLTERGEVWQGLSTNALWETNLDRVFKWDGVIQPTVWESAPGKIHMLMRSTRGFIYRSDSTDYGRTWCPAYATTAVNNNSGIDAVHRPNGRLVLAHNPVAGNWGRRYPIALSTSSDNGLTWERLFEMEPDEGEFSYPAIISEGQHLHLTYTWNRKNIAYWKIAIDG